MQSDIAFAIGVSARFDAADIAAICLREATGEMFVAWKGKGESLHAVVSFLVSCPWSLIETQALGRSRCFIRATRLVPTNNDGMARVESRKELICIRISVLQ